MSDKKQIVLKKQDVEDNLSRLLDASEGIYAALLSSIDGHSLARKSHSDFSDSRLAAMTSSCLALGEKIAIEAKQTDCNFVIIQNADGFLVLRRVGEKLVLSALANKNVSLGLVLFATNSSAESLEKAIKE